MNKNTISFENLETRTLMSAVSPLQISEAVVNGSLQLQINGTDNADQIRVFAVKGGLEVTNGSWSSAVLSHNYGSIVIHGNGGNDSITVDASVKVNAMIYGDAGNDTLVSGSGNDRIYGGAGSNTLEAGAGTDTLISFGGTNDKVVGGKGSDSFWADASDTLTGVTAAETNAGQVHKISGFYNGTTAIKTTNGAKAEPAVTSGSGYTYQDFSNNPLFSAAGPSENDIVQGQVGDCYFLATLSAIAKTDANLIKQSVTDLGDGTFAVQFARGNTKFFVHVDGELPTYSTGQLAYANFGAGNSIWVAVMEKAFTIFRTGAATYDSISGGWMSEVFSDLGKASDSIYYESNATTLGNWINSELTSGKAVTFAAADVAGSPIVGDHAYTVDGLVKDSKGNIVSLRLRNPWGIDGYTCTDGKNDGYVTITLAQALTCLMGASAATV